MAAGRMKVFVVAQDWFYSVCAADHRYREGLLVLVPQMLEQIVKVVALSELQVVERILRSTFDVPVTISDKFQQSNSSSECANFLLCSRDECPQCKLCRQRRDSTVLV